MKRVDEAARKLRMLALLTQEARLVAAKSRLVQGNDVSWIPSRAPAVSNLEEVVLFAHYLTVKYAT